MWSLVPGEDTYHIYLMLCRYLFKWKPYGIVSNKKKRESVTKITAAFMSALINVALKKQNMSLLHYSWSVSHKFIFLLVEKIVVQHDSNVLWLNECYSLQDQYKNVFQGKIMTLIIRQIMRCNNCINCKSVKVYGIIRNLCFCL